MRTCRYAIGLARLVPSGFATTATASSVTTLVVLGLALPPGAAGRRGGRPAIAALQVALSERGVYGGPIDGSMTVPTIDAVRTFQEAAGLAPDGAPGPLTRRALGSRRLGSRVLARGARGWDVVELQYRLARHGFPSGVIDGTLGPHAEAAIARFQRFAGLPTDGVAGPSTITALSKAPPRSTVTIAPPVDAPIGDGFGPRGNRFHAGVDFPAPMGTPVHACRAGRVTWVGPRPGWGLLVVIAHGQRLRSLYAHLSVALVAVGDRVSAGSEIGRVGATGDATGPHLHFELRVGGAAVDPVAALGR